MTKKEKLLQKFLENPEAMSFKKIERKQLKLLKNISMKNKLSNHYVAVNNKRYLYTLKERIDDGEKVTYFTCSVANIAQDFLSEDIPALLVDLPELIIAEKRYREKQKEVIRFRVSGEEKQDIMAKALKKGYKSVSSFLRDLAMKA